MSRYLLAIDQGTTSSRAMIFDAQGGFVASSQQEFSQHFPNEGWVEHDPEEIWQSVVEVVKEALEKAKASASDIIAVGITNQRETTVLWDKATGKAVYPAIVWQDRRTAEHCKILQQTQTNAKDAHTFVQQKTGLVIDPYFSATKIRWILDQVPEAQTLLAKEQLCAGTIDSFLIWKLTNGQSHVTDATNASRTNIFNIHHQQWDSELCEFFGVPGSILPKVLDSADEFGVCSADLFGAPIPIRGVAGDQQAALIGQTCFDVGMSKCTFGTGCFLILNTGDKAVVSEHGLLTTIAYRIKGKPTYAMEGSAFIAGAVIQWLRDGLGLLSLASESEAMANEVCEHHGVVFVPAFTGLGAPHWDPNARGAIFGLTRDTGPKEIVAAALESVCFQTQDLIKAMEQDGAQFEGLRVDGGMTENAAMMQQLADRLQTQVVVPSYTETTALGAAYLAGLQSGVFESFDQIKALWGKRAQYTPVQDEHWAKQKQARWQAAVEACKSFV